MNIFQLNCGGIIINEFECITEAEEITGIPSKAIKSCIQGYTPIINKYKFTYTPKNWICGLFPIRGQCLALIAHYEQNFDKLKGIKDYYSFSFFFSLEKKPPEFKIIFKSPTGFLIQPVFVNNFISGDIHAKKLKWHGSRNLFKIKKISKTPNIPQLLQIKKFFNKEAFRIQKAYRSWIWRKKYLWNPYTEIGRLHLIIQSKCYCQNDTM